MKSAYSHHLYPSTGLKIIVFHPPKETEISNTNSCTMFFLHSPFFTTSILTFLLTADGATKEGTILHLFFFCESLQPTLNLLHRLLSCLLPNVKINFELYWTLVSHARGRRREAVRLSNFLITSLKSTFYWLYRTSRFINPLPLWTLRVKNKIILDYEFYKLKNNLPAFNKRWSFNDSLFTIDGDIFTWLI